MLIREAKERHGEIKVIPTTTEKYISFTIGDVVFKDSYAFTQASLESLAKNLESHQFINTRRWLEHNENSDAEDEEEDEPNEIDMSFIDDRKRVHTFLDSDDDDDNDMKVKHGRMDNEIEFYDTKEEIEGEYDDDEHGNGC